MSVDVELRKLNPGPIFKIVEILECGESWKQLMSIIPVEMDDSKAMKYTMHHMKMIECASRKQQRPCSQIFLEEWGTSGKNRPRLSSLLRFLVKAELFRAAEFVAVDLLKEDPPQRPSSGPAARVQIPDPDQIPLVPVPGWEPLPSAPNPRINPGEAPNPRIILVKHLILGSILQRHLILGSILQKHVIDEDDRERNVFFMQDGAPPHYLTDKSVDWPIDVCTELRINYADLRAATNNFDEGFVIGRGAWGSVYRGELNSPNHQEAVEVAIKRLHSEGTPGDPFLQFQTEIEQLSQLSHQNLLPLVGYSIHGPELCLVYSYMENGSLMDRLASQEALHWKTRVNIALGSAEGILFLHTVLPKPLVHRDVKTANILLDGEMIPKLGDFGLVRLGSSGEKDTSVKTKLAVGTSAYMAPEAFQGDISVKMDVFSFGVVMLELLTGLPPFDEDREERDIASHFLDQEERPILEHLDQTAGTWEPSIAEELSKLALGCLESKKKRPNMMNVSQILRDISERIPL
ncbi:interleukin-1 receptor-associated kinase 4 [Nilaparvata lugens]|uniref:interleukin-1 receptor-associated kinase 4 n=1 Tax=Nilaparvata lugens TaxID=108931 RepID=UPI00193D71BA|nr:interleukin-1 receptor-associated kinase 4 [Nilaparvata lugens]